MRHRQEVGARSWILFLKTELSRQNFLSSPQHHLLQDALDSNMITLSNTNNGSDEGSCRTHSGGNGKQIFGIKFWIVYQKSKRFLRPKIKKILLFCQLSPGRYYSLFVFFSCNEMLLSTMRSLGWGGDTKMEGLTDTSTCCASEDLP